MLEHISNVLLLMEKHGISLLLNAVFIVVIINSLKTNQKNILILIENTTKLMDFVEEKILKGQLHDNVIKVIVKNKWREFLKDYNKEIYLYLLKNNIEANYNNIDMELLNLINKQVYSLKTLIQDKTTNFNVEKLSAVVRKELEETHSQTMLVFKDLIENKYSDKYEITRILTNHFDHRLDEGLTVIDNTDI